MNAMAESTRRLLAALLLATGMVHAQEAVRPELGKALQSAQELMKEGKYKDALARIRDADAAGNHTPYERYLLDSMRGAAAASSGDEATASKSYEAVLANGRLQTTEKLPIIEALAGTAYRTKDYARALEWTNRYFKEGGGNPKMRSLQTSAH
jgi:hypothetical protein